jgi:hypothetical protein
MDEQPADNEERQHNGSEQGPLNQTYLLPDCPYLLEKAHETPSLVNCWRYEDMPNDSQHGTINHNGMFIVCL